LIRGVLLIAAGDARRVLVVAAESSLHPMFLENYRRLGVLAPEGAGCRPFDRDRQGFCLSEAAAAVMLESARKNIHQPPAGADKKIAIESFAYGADATHLTGSDPTGRPLRNLLARVVAGRRFDFVHAHGTGTIANDPVELHAVESVLPDSPGSPPPAIYSHKAALGHSLGASGLISVVLNVQMHRKGMIPANLNTPHPLPAGRVTIGQHIERRPIRRSLAVAAGFGGAMAAVGLITLE
jgi:3-oxoacyl-(acyl-carrier-protein) synthase